MSENRSARIALVRQGDTPIVNTRLAAVVQEAFPDHVVEDIDLLAELRRARVDAALVVGAAATEHGVDVLRRRTNGKRAVLTSAAFTRFARQVLRRRVDPQRTRFVLQSQSLFSAVVPGVPHVVYTDHVHLANLSYPGFDREQLLPAAFLRREAELYHRCAAILVRSSNIRSVLQHGYGVDPGRVAVVGVGPNAPVTPMGAVQRPWYGGRITYVGIDWERKGGPVLLDAFERIRGRHPTARLEIVGAAPSRTPPGVSVRGRLPVAEVASLIERSDVFCLPTLAEPFGVVFVEAMLAGVPVVGTRLGAQPDFILPGRTGELVPPSDAVALAAALDRLLADPDRTRRLGRQAADLAADRYSWPRVGQRIRDAVEAALEAGSHGPVAAPPLRRTAEPQRRRA